MVTCNVLVRYQAIYSCSRLGGDLIVVVASTWRWRFRLAPLDTGCRFVGAGDSKCPLLLYKNISSIAFFCIFHRHSLLSEVPAFSQWCGFPVLQRRSLPGGIRGAFVGVFLQGVVRCFVVIFRHRWSPLFLLLVLMRHFSCEDYRRCVWSEECEKFSLLSLHFLGCCECVGGGGDEVG
jgi:hypothetical protein